jgi:hypothetical protein
MATNAPTPGDDTVPSAQAERRRIWFGDTTGVAIYSVLVALIFVAVLGIVIAT